MASSVASAWAVGFGVVLLSEGAWWLLFVAGGGSFDLLEAERFWVTPLQLLGAFPVAAAFVSAWLAPRDKVFVGASMAVTVALTGVGGGWIATEAFGFRGDFYGLRGAITNATLFLIVYALPCTAAAAAAYFLTRPRTSQQ